MNSTSGWHITAFESSPTLFVLYPPLNRPGPQSCLRQKLDYFGYDEFMKKWAYSRLQKVYGHGSRAILNCNAGYNKQMRPLTFTCRNGVWISNEYSAFKSMATHLYQNCNKGKPVIEKLALLNYSLYPSKWRWAVPPHCRFFFFFASLQQPKESVLVQRVQWAIEETVAAFNSLNRRVMLHNVQRLFPSFATTCVLNYYRSYAVCGK